MARKTGFNVFNSTLFKKTVKNGNIYLNLSQYFILSNETY